MFVAEIFGLNLIFIVSALALLHLDSQYVAAQQAAAFMLIASLTISFTFSAIATLQYSFKFSIKKSIYVTLGFVIIGLVVSQIIGALISS
jgi:hypothetical protein